MIRALVAGLTLFASTIVPAGGSGGHGQPGGPGTGSVATPHSEVEKVRLVLLPTSVTTRRGKPVRGLQAADFRLFEDGVAQEIGVFAADEETPLEVAFLLDVSGSMALRGQLSEAKRAIRGFVESLEPRDRFGLICFADHQVTWVTDLTSDKPRFLERLDVQYALGRTALYDALAASPHLVDDQTRGRRAIVLITDGLDNFSELPMLRAVWLARQVNVPIYAISFLPVRPGLVSKRGRRSLHTLERFSSETGGTHFAVHDSREVERAISRIQSELRSQYVIGYYPSVRERDGAFRIIELGTVREGLRVRTRKGYYADP